MSAASFFRARFVHLQVSTAEILPIESGNRAGRFRIIRHFHERKSAGPARLAIRGDVNSRNLAERLEERTKIALGRLKIHVAYEQIFHARALLEFFQTGLLRIAIRVCPTTSGVSKNIIGQRRIRRRLKRRSGRL
jgi:hypothetical protein